MLQRAIGKNNFCLFSKKEKKKDSLEQYSTVNSRHSDGTRTSADKQRPAFKAPAGLDFQVGLDFDTDHLLPIY